MCACYIDQSLFNFIELGKYNIWNKRQQLVQGCWKSVPDPDSEAVHPWCKRTKTGYCKKVVYWAGPKNNSWTRASTGMLQRLAHAEPRPSALSACAGRWGRPGRSSLSGLAGCADLRASQRCRGVRGRSCVRQRLQSLRCSASLRDDMEEVPSSWSL